MVRSILIEYFLALSASWRFKNRTLKGMRTQCATAQAVISMHCADRILRQWATWFSAQDSFNVEK